MYLFISSDHNVKINIIVKAFFSINLTKFTYIILTQHLALNRLSINAVMRKAITVSIDLFFLKEVCCSNIHEGLVSAGLRLSLHLGKERTLIKNGCLAKLCKYDFLFKLHYHPGKSVIGSNLPLSTRSHSFSWTLKDVKSIQSIWEIPTIQLQFPVLLMSTPPPPHPRPSSPRGAEGRPVNSFRTAATVCLHVSWPLCDFWGKTLLPHPAQNELRMSPLDHILSESPSLPLCNRSLQWMGSCFGSLRLSWKFKRLHWAQIPNWLWDSLYFLWGIIVFPFSPFPRAPCHSWLLPLFHPQNMAKLPQMVGVLTPTK